MLSELRKHYDTPVYQALIDYLDSRLENGQSVKEFIDLSNLSETEVLLTGIAQIEQNKRICFQDTTQICKVITIENLTTFFRWEEPESFMIYLGGFLIYEDLCHKTGIPFKRYKMDLDNLKQYEKYGKALTEYMLTVGVKLEQECLVSC